MAQAEAPWDREGPEKEQLAGQGEQLGVSRSQEKFGSEGIKEHGSVEMLRDLEQ